MIIKIIEIFQPKILRLDKFIANNYPNLSRSKIKNLIINNKLLINNQIFNNPHKKYDFSLLSVYNKLKIILNIKELSKNTNNILPEKIPLNIIYEDEDFLIIDKQINLVVHPSYSHTNGTLINALAYYYPDNKYLPRYGLVHRLDKNTTGIMIIAKKINFYIYLKNLFKTHTIKRYYDALVYGIIKNIKGMINLPIHRHPYKKTCMGITLTGKPAITYYKVTKYLSNSSRIRVNLQTGRTHQIRVHFSYLNHPIIGDKLYFNSKFLNLSKSLNFNRPALHSAKLIFFHPKYNQYKMWKSPLPKDMKELLSKLTTN